MNIVEELEEQYFDIEDQYASQEFEARSGGDAIKEEYWRNRRNLNTHAYFLFLFTRLEDHIKTESVELITEKRASIVDWKTKAVWENTDADNLYFKKRVALLTEKGRSDYNKIVEYYDSRNTIAHGETIPDITVTIDMIGVFRDMKRFFIALRR